MLIAKKLQMVSGRISLIVLFTINEWAGINHYQENSTIPKQMNNQACMTQLVLTINIRSKKISRDLPTGSLQECDLPATPSVCKRPIGENIPY